MKGSRKDRISAAFGAAGDYDRHAVIQRAVAARLADAIAARPTAPAPRVLEIGCGTGFLSAELAGRIAGGRWLLTDISALMVDRCRTLLGGDPRFDFAVMDGEAPCAGEQPYDLIASSLAAQWFVDLPGALERAMDLLRPGGCLALATLADGTFAEWRQAHADVGLVDGTPAYPSMEALRRLRPGGAEAMIETVPMIERHADAFAFLRSLKAIGAGTAAPGRRPLSAGQLRRAMDRFEAGGSAVTYCVALCLFTKPMA